MQLRPYQLEAKHAVYDFLRHKDTNPVVVIPTAGGKTPVMATICREAVSAWHGRVLILAHVCELVEQAVEKLCAVAPDLWLQVGVYSASLGSRDTDKAIIAGQVQSVFRRACELGPFDLILVDEVHTAPPDGEGMYRTFLREAKVVNPNVRLIGFTATPYRMSTGMICGPDNLFNEICYEISVKELVLAGYLCRLKSKAGKHARKIAIRYCSFGRPQQDHAIDVGGIIARARAIAWWRERSDDPLPMTAAEAVELCEDGGIAETHAITVRSITGEKYDRIVNHKLGPKPPARGDSSEAGLPAYQLPDDELPF
ncbi:MAG TPA: DEAD/DEAH box helicase family protein [Planctomycetota bacterium]|nr:DEAD/DEAH box helicase family protein [Planctomycetota bacterium]